MVYSVVELVIAVWLGMLPALGAGIAGVNIAPEVAVVTLIRHLTFGLVLGINFEGKNCEDRIQSSSHGKCSFS